MNKGHARIKMMQYICALCSMGDLIIVPYCCIFVFFNLFRVTFKCHPPVKLASFVYTTKITFTGKTICWPHLADLNLALQFFSKSITLSVQILYKDVEVTLNKTNYICKVFRKLYWWAVRAFIIYYIILVIFIFCLHIHFITCFCVLQAYDFSDTNSRLGTSFRTLQILQMYLKAYL